MLDRTSVERAGGLLTIETAVLGLDMIYGLLDLVVVGHVELNDFNFRFDALRAKFLDRVLAGVGVAAGEKLKGGREALCDELDDSKAKTLIGTCCENDLRRHGVVKKCMIERQ